MMKKPSQLLSRRHCTPQHASWRKSSSWNFGILRRRSILLVLVCLDLWTRCQYFAFHTGGQVTKPNTVVSAYSRTRQFEVSSSRRAGEPMGLGRDPAPALSISKSMKRPGSPVVSMSKSTKGADSVQPSVGAIFAFMIVLALAITTEGSQDMSSQMAEGEMVSVARGTMENVVGASLPMSSTDLVASALGDSIGGIIGSVCGGFVSMIGAKTRVNSKPVVTEAIADSDFFIANSASLPLLAAVGLPPGLASVASVVVAAVPSQLVKLGSRQNERRLQEKNLMLQLLGEERAREETRNSLFYRFRFGGKVQPKNVGPEDLKPVVETKIDFVDVFSDVTRWLAYGVLQKDFGESLVLNGYILNTSLTGALFGCSAAVSSQLYADVLYGLFRYGPESRQQEVFSRKTIDWLAVYSSKAASTAALFGVYEYSQGPISFWIQATLEQVASTDA
jgi:hypothetical protein